MKRAITHTAWRTAVVLGVTTTTAGAARDSEDRNAQCLRQFEAKQRADQVSG